MACSRFFQNFCVRRRYLKIPKVKLTYLSEINERAGSMAGPSRTVNRAGIRTSEWIRTRGSDGFQTRVDPEDPDIVYTLSQNGDLGRLNKRTVFRPP